MAKQFYLTEKDKAIIQALIRKELHGFLNPRSQTLEDFLPGAPDTYIIKVPTDGIPKRTGTTPGKAECELFKLQADDETVSPGSATFTLTAVKQVDGTTPEKIWVFNIYKFDIKGNTDEADIYLKVTRDKFGYWLSEGPVATAKAIVKIGSTGPIRFDPSSPFDLQGFLADVVISGNGEWGQLLASDDCITP